MTYGTFHWLDVGMVNTACVYTPLFEVSTDVMGRKWDWVWLVLMNLQAWCNGKKTPPL